MIILKQLEKKNKSIQKFPFVMKDDYLIVVLTMMVTLSLKVWLEFSFCKELCGLVGASCDSKQFF